MSDKISIIREKNVNWSISISALITTISYVIISIISLIVGDFIFYGLVLFADVEFLLGSIFGGIYFFKNRDPHQDFLKYGIIVGVIGGILSCIFVSTYQMIVVTIAGSGNIIVFFLYLGLTFISGAVIGLLSGTFIALYYSYKDVKGDKVEKEHFDDKFFDDLIDK